MLWAVLVSRKPAGPERLKKRKGTADEVAWRTCQWWKRFGLEALHVVPKELLIQLEMRRICQARGEKPQPLKFLSPVLGSGTGITAKLTSWPSREAQASGWRRPCFSVSVSALCNFLSSCLEVGKLLVLTLLCRALGTSLSPGGGGPWRSDHWRWSSEPLLTSSQYLCAKVF